MSSFCQQSRMKTCGLIWLVGQSACAWLALSLWLQRRKHVCQRYSSVVGSRHGQNTIYTVYTSRSDLLVLKQVLHVYVLDWSRLYYVVYILALDQHLGHRCWYSARTCLCDMSKGWQPFESLVMLLPCDMTSVEQEQCTWQVCRYWTPLHWRRLFCHLTLRRHSISTQGLALSKLSTSFLFPLQTLEMWDSIAPTKDVKRKCKSNNKHDSTQKHTNTHTHTQRSVQVSLTISDCTVSTDFSWVSRNYFAPPFSTPWRSCLCSFTFPRFFCWGNCPPLELHQQYTVWFCEKPKPQSVRIGSHCLDTQVWPIPYS